MSIVRVLRGAAAARSSSVSTTRSSPSSSYATSASSFEQNRRCSMREESSRSTSRKETVFDSVAVCSFTGTVISPKAIVPFQIDRAMPSAYPVARPRVTPGAG